ncbi:hypothetical protein Rhe02_10370 [Rhizocola hellebori]|uniref:Uncharacterized protein n=1 Tax=Rhizocola hellebori TaxID=1392758 RepID=A0A8J3Q343_9ACTN|nr:hypothetical protein [Rhizocola hellebori]GIH02970.1 hypothetical protein Rhe02_10370 [Rhizocola hellebori]
MTRSDLPSDAPVESGDIGPRPATVSPAARSSWPQWPSPQQALGLVGAFLLGACLCGGAGLVIGGIAGTYSSDHGPGRDGYYRRDDYYRRDGDFRPLPLPPTPAANTPAAPSPSVSPTPSVSPKPTPSRVASASPSPSPSPS